MNIIDVLMNDEEIQLLKKQYKERFNKNAPPFCIDTDGDIDKYKRKLRAILNSDKG